MVTTFSNFQEGFHRFPKLECGSEQAAILCAGYIAMQLNLNHDAYHVHTKS